MPVDILWLRNEVYRHACGYCGYITKFTDTPVDILWLHTRSLQTYLWIFCGYIYQVYRHACGHSVVTHTKFTDCLWIFYGYTYTKHLKMCGSMEIIL